MKNRLSILIIFLLSLFNSAIADNVKFNTTNIEIFQNENRIISGKGKVFFLDKNIEINANAFDYNKNDLLLIANGNGTAIINSKNILLKFDNLIYDENNNLIKIDGNAQVLNFDQNIIASSKNFFYEINNNLIFSDSETNIKKNNTNNIKVDGFKFDTNKNIIRLTNLQAKDELNNVIKSELAFINAKTGKIFGKDITINFNNLFFNEDNEPRLKANSIISDNTITELTNGTFTLCKKRDGCPPWQMSAKKNTT
jgi:LPS-assembly protein